MKKILITFISLVLAGFISMGSQNPGNSYISVDIKSLSINEKGSAEIAPVIYKNSLVFSKIKKGEYRSGLFSSGNKAALFIADKDTRGRYDQPKKIKINGLSSYDITSVCFNKRGNKMMFTRNKRKRAEKGKQITLGIYEASSLYNMEWDHAKGFTHNFGDYDVLHPTISDNGSVLIFVANIPGRIWRNGLICVEQSRRILGKTGQYGSRCEQCRR